MSQIFMIVINTIFGLLGICIIGLASYGLATFASWEDHISRTGLIIGVCFGVFTTLISFLGCFGAIKKNKVMLGIYMFFELIITVIMIIAAIVTLVWGGQIQRADTETGRDVSNVVTYAFMSCCFNRLGADAVLDYGPYNTTESRTPKMCASPEYIAAHHNVTHAQDEQSLNEAKLLAGCYFPKCTSATSQTPNYCSRVGQVTIANSPTADEYGVPLEMCSGITTLVFDGSGAQEASSCRGGLPVWGGKVNQVLADNIYLIGVALAIVSTLLLLLFISSVALCMTHREKFDATA
jgi:hypothetical protein